MNQVFKWCLLFRDLCLILTMFSGCCVWIPHYKSAWLAVCDTVIVLLGDIVLLAFEKILVLFYGHRKNCIFTTAQISVYNCTIFYNCTICAQLHTPIQAPKIYVFGGLTPKCYFSLLRPPKRHLLGRKHAFWALIGCRTTRGATGTLSEEYKKYIKW